MLVCLSRNVFRNRFSDFNQNRHIGSPDFCYRWKNNFNYSMFLDSSQTSGNGTVTARSSAIWQNCRNASGGDGDALGVAPQCPHLHGYSSDTRAAVVTTATAPSLGILLQTDFYGKFPLILWLSHVHIFKSCCINGYFGSCSFLVFQKMILELGIPTRRWCVLRNS